MSLSGNQLTGVGPVQVRRAYLPFTAKETSVSIDIFGGQLISVNSIYQLVNLDSGNNLISLTSTPTLVKT